MGNHFASIGLELPTHAAMAQLIGQIAPLAVRVEADVGFYLRWRSTSGGELWIQVVDSDVVGVDPHFVGAARMSARLVRPIPHPGDSPLDGAWYAWANPHGETGDYPFVFSAPDARLIDALELPAVRTLQIAVFAHHIEVAATHDQLTPLGEGMRLSPRAAIPNGLFVEEGTPPAAVVTYAGEVIAAARVDEPRGGAFFHIHLATLGGEVDVVAGEDALREAPAPGSAVRVTGWVSARIVEDA